MERASSSEERVRASRLPDASNPLRPLLAYHNQGLPYQTVALLSIYNMEDCQQMSQWLSGWKAEISRVTYRMSRQAIVSATNVATLSSD